MANLLDHLNKPITYRCMVCRWVFPSNRNVNSPTCPHCKCTSQFHELAAIDFQDEDRYKEFGPAHAKDPGVKPPLKLWIPDYLKDIKD